MHLKYILLNAYDANPVHKTHTNVHGMFLVTEYGYH